MREEQFQKLMSQGWMKINKNMWDEDVDYWEGWEKRNGPTPSTYMIRNKQKDKL